MYIGVFCLQQGVKIFIVFKISYFERAMSKWKQVYNSSYISSFTVSNEAWYSFSAMKWHFYGIAQIEWRQKNINIVNTYSYHVSLVSSLYLKDQHELRFLTRASRDYFNQSELRIFSYWPIRDKYFVYSRFFIPYSSNSQYPRPYL